MAGILYTMAAFCVVASAAPPSAPRPYSNQHQQKYVFDFADETSYYNPALQKQDYQSNPAQNSASGRLETFEDPNNQVELIQPQQSPQQPSAAAPNVPGIAPGQRVYIVHMPLPGYRPGTIGGYQPVYVVAASPAPNAGNVPGYQQTPVYQQEGGVPLGAQLGPGGVQQSGFVFRGVQSIPQTQGFLLQPPYNVYQEPLLYQPVAALPVAAGAAQHQPQNQQAVRLNQYVGLRAQSQSPAAQSAALQAHPAAESKRDDTTASIETKEATEEPRRSSRPEAQTHGSARPKP